MRVVGLVVVLDLLRHRLLRPPLPPPVPLAAIAAAALCSAPVFVGGPTVVVAEHMAFVGRISHSAVAPLAVTCPARPLRRIRTYTLPTAPRSPLPPALRRLTMDSLTP